MGAEVSRSIQKSPGAEYELGSMGLKVPFWWNAFSTTMKAFVSILPYQANQKRGLFLLHEWKEDTGWEQPHGAGETLALLF